MKRTLFAALLCICCMVAQAQEKLQLKEFKTVSLDETTQTFSLMKSVWPDNSNGVDQESALIRVSFENLTRAEAAEVKYGTSPNMSICDQKFWEQDETGRYWIWVDSGVKDGYIEAVAPGGIISNRLNLPVLQPKGIYEVVLMSEKSLTIHVKTLPAENAKVFIDGEFKGMANQDIPNVKIGKHQLKVSYEGTERVNQEITVSESSVSFGTFDFRPKKIVNFTSDPHKATLYINGEEKGLTPMKLELPYDNYSVEVKLGVGEYDQQSITVNATSPEEIKLEPIKKKTFEAIAMYNGRKVTADLYVDGKIVEPKQESYTLTKPLGKTYNMLMSYYGDTKKRRIRVTEDMDNEQIFQINARNQIVWPWQREYDVAPMGFSAGYVQKQLVTTGEGSKYKEDGVYGEDGSKLHGMQFGLHFQPCFSFGLGLYTGLFYEYYLKDGKDDWDGIKFEEHCLYMPLHGYYRLPFAEKVALSIHGGIGVNYAVKGSYKSDEDDAEETTDFYGDEGYPKRLNLTAEIGVGFRVGPVQLNAQMAKGLNDHKSYVSQGGFKTKQNKLSLSLSYVFGSGL